MRSLISLTFSMGLPFGSSISQSITSCKNKVGQEFLSMHPIFTLWVDCLIISSVIILGLCLLMSTPTSLITSIARRLTILVGEVPALSGSYFLVNTSERNLQPSGFFPHFLHIQIIPSSCSCCLGVYLLIY